MHPVRPLRRVATGQWFIKRHGIAKAPETHMIPMTTVDHKRCVIVTCEEDDSGRRDAMKRDLGRRHRHVMHAVHVSCNVEEEHGLVQHIDDDGVPWGVKMIDVHQRQGICIV
jgi:hypothetical protein